MGEREQRKVRADEFGVYVLTGGYAFRPLEDKPTQYKEGDRVPARHVGGTFGAIVGEGLYGTESWWSSPRDPQYQKAVYGSMRPGIRAMHEAHLRDNPNYDYPHQNPRRFDKKVKVVIE